MSLQHRNARHVNQINSIHASPVVSPIIGIPVVVVATVVVAPGVVAPGTVADVVAAVVGAPVAGTVGDPTVVVGADDDGVDCVSPVVGRGD